MHIMVQVISVQHRLKPHGISPFNILANQYSTKESASNVNGLTLVFLHAVGHHKETWEPTIQKLFEFDQESSTQGSIIRDMFSIEIPNHGESAQLNEEVIGKMFTDSCKYRRRYSAYISTELNDRAD